MKVLLKNAAGKQVEFSPREVDYMIANGWVRVKGAEPKPKRKSKTGDVKK